MTITDAARKAEQEILKEKQRGNEYKRRYENELQMRKRRDKQIADLKAQLKEAHQEIGELTYYIEQHRKAAA